MKWDECDPRFPEPWVCTLAPVRVVARPCCTVPRWSVRRWCYALITLFRHLSGRLSAETGMAAGR